MDSNNNTSNMEKLNIVQVIILILLGIERIFKLCVNSKCLKKMTCKFLGYNFINFESEELEEKDESKNNNNKE